MEEQNKIIAEKRVVIVGAKNPKQILLWPVSQEGMENMKTNYERICFLSGEKEFALVGIEITRWGDELSPWKYEDGRRIFLGEARELLCWILEKLCPFLCEWFGKSKEEMVWNIGGYSLAGLFAVWTCYETDLFEGVASCSGSLWYPDFILAEEEKKSFVDQKNVNVKKAYFSVGNKEAKVRHPLMHQVEKATEKLYQKYLQSERVESTVFILNPGNHFQEPEERMRKGFGWLLQKR